LPETGPYIRLEDILVTKAGGSQKFFQLLCQ